MDIIVNVTNQRLKVASNLKHLVEGSQNFVRFVFNMDYAWDNLIVTAQFIQNGVGYSVILDNDNSAYLPSEIEAGEVKLVLFGAGGDVDESMVPGASEGTEAAANTIATTNYLAFEVDENIFISDARSTDFNNTMYTQICAMIQAADLDWVRGQLTLKASQADLAAEVRRATASEGDLSTAIGAKADSTTVTNLTNRVTALENGSAWDTVISQAVANKIAELIESGAMAEMTIEDGSISRAKVDTNFEETLDKADSAMQPSMYDPLGYGERGVDPYEFADAHDTTTKTQLLSNESVTINIGNSDTATYTGLVNAISGALAHARGYAEGLINTYQPINIEIVQSIDTSQAGRQRTFYLVPKTNGNGYDKWWYIEDSNHNSFWDKFGSSTTFVVTSLPVNPDPEADYILASNGEYQYYKYISNQWVLIAGSTAVILGAVQSSSDTIEEESEDSPSEGLAGGDTPTGGYTTIGHTYGGYNCYVFGTGAPAISAEDAYANDKLYVDTDTMAVYAPNLSEGVYSWVSGGALVPHPSESKDYFIQDDTHSWGHFRYLSTPNKFVQIGISSYSREEINQLIQDSADELSGDISDVASDVSSLTTRLNNLANLVKDVTINAAKTELTVTYMDNSTSTIELDTGIDIDSTAYNTNDDNTLRFYDSNGNELENLAVVIEGGGGGGGAVSGTVSIGRITPANVQCVYGDDVSIQYTCLAKDSSGDAVGSGTGTLYVNNIAVLNGFTVATSDTGASNTIPVGEYLTVGSNTVKVSVSVNVGGESNQVATKTWTVNAVNMSLTWNYTDSQINTSAVTDYYTPFGALNKTIYTFIDVDSVGFNPEIVDALPDSTAEDFDEDDVIGVNYFLHSGSTYTHYVWDTTTSAFVQASGSVLDATTTTRSGVQQSLTIPMQTHGSHAIVRYMVGTVNGVTIKTTPQVHDMVFVVSGTTTPIIATSFNTATMTQYNTVQIPIVVYDPARTATTVTLAENGTTVSTWTNVDRTVHYWNYSPTTYGAKTLTITCGATTKTINITVEQLSLNEQEVTGYDFRFKASEMATNDSVRSWSATYTPVGSSTTQTVDITFSQNFDWVNGGLHTEEDENGHIRQFFVVRAGTTATFNYNLFGQNYDPKEYGKTFKFIFKAVNCRTYDANVLTCMDTSNGNNGVGLVMTANEATLTTANNSLKTYYYKDSYIEFETNIHRNAEYPYLQIWMDGSHDTVKLYDSSDSMQQVTPVGITVGSPNCDVYIYMMKAYPISLTNSNELSNFIMDAPNAYEMVDRYNRNDILNESGEVDYEKLAVASPDLRVLLLDLNRMSTGKKDNVVAYTARHIYNRGGESHCFTVNNACVTIQGTSSVGYLESAGNVDINFKNGREFTSDNVSYTTSSVTFDDGTVSTKGYAMTDNSIQVDYLNVKLNVASSENANNACIADWYNTYQPWTSPVRKKNPKARDTMEFTPGAIFIRDRSGGLFGDTTGYHFYGICDIGNSKKNKKVFHDSTNPLAVCVEVANNTSLPCLMSSDDYTWNSDDEAVVQELDADTGEMKDVKVYEFRYVEDGKEALAENAWDRFVKFMVDYNPNLATNEPLVQSVTFGNYTFKGSGSYDTSSYDDDNVVYLYGHGLPNVFGYAASDYVTDASAEKSYYYINYSNNTIYSSNGTTWAAGNVLTWTADRNNVLAGTSIGTYAGTYTTDSREYRMAYMLEHCEEYMVIDPVIYHFVFIESFLMTDNVAKNTFWSSDDLVHWEPSKDYDNDTALGNDNVGGLSFTYGLETDDTVGSSYVFNAHDASWITFARGLFGACQNMYRNRESAGCFDSANFLAKVKTWQATRPERVWVADAQRKYLRPYEDNGTVTYIPMLCGRKTHQRAQVKTYNSFYYASKYVSSFCTSQNIMVRGNTPTTWQGVAPQNKATLSMYINCYIVVASTSYNVVAKTKAVRGQSYVMDFSSIGSMGETELYFCTAPMITELSGLAHLYFKQNNFAMGTNLQRLEIGSNVSGYTNPNLENLTIGNNKMLEYLDVRNCPNATGALDLSGCVSLSELYLENTAFTGITFATGGLLSVAHLPSPTSLTMRELIYVADLTLGSANALATLRVEDCDFANTAELTIGNTTTAHGTKDITLNLVESSPNLSRTRLIGIDWILQNENVLNRIYNMAGISDSSYDIAQSVLTGDVYVPTMRSGLYDKFMAVWQYLTITYSTMVAQYLATFVNDDGSAILGRNGNAYTQWVDSGSSPYNPITMGYTISIYNSGNPTTSSYDASEHSGEYYYNTDNGAIYLSDGTDWNFVVMSDVLIPSKASTAQYVYTFTGWDDLSAMSTARTITAQYSSTTRTYTVTWWKNPSTSLEIQTGVLYGAEVNYSGDIPQDTTQESTYTYKLFKGWDKSTGFITGDTNVYAVWDEASGFPSTSVEMSDMTPVQIYGIGQAGKQADYFEDLDYVDIKLGHDFDFSNVQSCEIGKDKMLTGIPRDTFVSGGYYFDGEHTYTTDIKLFDENSPAFTMVVDFQFSDVTSNSTLVSGDDGNTWVFRIYHNGTNVVLRWGDQSVNIGYGQYRDIVVVRHPQGSKRLLVYAAGNVASDRYGDSVVRTPLLSNTLPQTTKGLTFGGVEYPVGYRDYAKGHVHWCKIWYEDIGEENAYALASWPRETIRLEYWGAEKFYYYGTSTKSKLSFICNSQLGGLRGRGYYMNSSNTNVGGWNESKMRTFCNGRVFNALPTEWQAMIKAVEILTTQGNQSTAITQAEDKIYLPSYYDVGGSGTGYNDEHGATATRIPWLTSNPRRIKFRGKTRKYASDSEITIYVQTQEPAALLQTDITPGSIWINTSNSSIGYIFVEKDELDEYGFTASIAADPEYALGGWMIASSWWSRSSYVSSATSFGFVSTGGGLTNYNASSTYGVVFGFST